MPNLRSSFKRVRVAGKKAARNRPIRTFTRTLVATAQEAMTSHVEDSSQALQQALRQLDRAASKGVIHPNNAARRKSRLVQRFNALTRVQET
ncbi:MAG: 30S ribosomal protein S20 [Chloroflexi bacterium]|nr:30S ribosomal protein S20 [Chloroflexota bacterium]